MADSGKKRKRAEDGAQKPSKKIAIQAPIPVKDVEVSVVTGTDNWAPIVGMQDLIFSNLWSFTLTGNPICNSEFSIADKIE